MALTNVFAIFYVVRELSIVCMVEKKILLTELKKGT